MRVLVALTSILFSLTAFAADPVAAPTAPKNYVEGKDYFLLAEPVRTNDPSKIEVAEVFAYTCPHCMHFEPIIEAWIKTQPADVNLVQIHTSWSAAMEPYQRGFYTAVALKIKDKVQMGVFNAVHGEHRELNTAEEWADYFALYGIDKKTAVDVYGSFGVNSQISQANARTRAYKTTGTPELVVDGKYRISSSSFVGSEQGAQNEMLSAAQFLINKIRKDRGTVK